MLLYCLREREDAKSRRLELIYLRGHSDSELCLQCTYLCNYWVS